MSPLHAWALAAAGAAAALPIAIHLLTRPRLVRYPLPTVRFLRAAAGDRSRWSRLRDAIVLVLRTVAVVALGLAFARLATRPAVDADHPAAPLRRIIVLDCSLSMGARLDSGATVFDTARALAQRSLSGGVDEADLVLAGARAAAVFGRPSANVAALRADLARARVLPERLDIGRALAACAEVVATIPEADRARTSVLIVSDFQRANWGAADFSALPAGIDVQLLPVSASSGENLALSTPRLDGVLEAGARAAASCAITRHGAPANAPARAAEVVLELDGRAYRQTVELAAGQRRTVSFEVELGRARVVAGELRIDARDARDALAEDDAAPLAALVRQRRRIAVISGGGRADDQAAFLIRAAFEARAATTELVATALADVPIQLEALASTDLVVIGDVGKLDGPAVDALVALLARGVPVLYVAQHEVDAANLAQLERALGASARLPVVFRPARQAAERFLVAADVERRPFSVFGTSLDRLIRRFALPGGLDSELRLAGSRDVRAEYSDGSAFLVVSSAGTARLAVLNALLRGRDDLASSPMFVPMLQELYVELARGRDADARRVEAGQSFALDLTGAAASHARWRVQAAAGDAGFDPPSPGDPVDPARPSLDVKGAIASVAWDRAGAPGVWHVLTASAEPGPLQLTDAFAVEAPAAESDLAVLDPETIRSRLAAGRRVTVAAAPPRADVDEAIAPFLVIAALALLLELAVLKVFRS